MKIKLASIALSGVMLLSSAVSAAGLDFDPKLYVGGEIQGNKYQGAKKLQNGNATLERADKKRLFSKSVLSGSLILGSRLNEWFGIEAGATKAASFKLKLANALADPSVTDGSNVRVKSRNFYADLLGFVPVTDQFELLGSVGVGRLSSHAKGYGQNKAHGSAKVDISSKSSKTGVRLGAGIGVKLDENISARLMVRHQKGNKHIKNVNSAGVGLFYQF